MGITVQGQILAHGAFQDSKSAPSFALLCINHREKIAWAQIVSFDNVTDKVGWCNPSNWTSKKLMLDDCYSSLSKKMATGLAPTSCHFANCANTMQQPSPSLRAIIKTSEEVIWLSQGVKTLSIENEQLASVDLLR